MDVGENNPSLRNRWEAVKVLFKAWARNYPLTLILVVAAVIILFLFPQLKTLFNMPLPWQMDDWPEMRAAIGFLLSILAVTLVYLGFTIAVVPRHDTWPRELRPQDTPDHDALRAMIQPFFVPIEGIRTFFAHPLRLPEKLVSSRNRGIVGSLLMLFSALLFAGPFMFDGGGFWGADYHPRLKITLIVFSLGLVLAMSGVFTRLFSGPKMKFGTTVVSRMLVILFIMNTLGEVIWLICPHLPYLGYRPYTNWALLHIIFFVLLVSRIVDSVSAHFPKNFVVFAALALFIFAGIQFSTVRVGDSNDGDAMTIESWLADFEQRLEKIPEDGPVIVVSASGGGARAALFTTLALESLEQQAIDRASGEPLTGGEIPVPNNVLIVSGVSGGSLAVAHHLKRPTTENESNHRARNFFAGEVRKEINRLIKKGTPRENTSASESSESAGSPDLGHSNWYLRSAAVDEMVTDFTAPWLRGILLPGIERGQSVSRFWHERLKWQTETSPKNGLPPPMLLFNSAEVVDLGAKLVVGEPPLPSSFLPSSTSRGPHPKTNTYYKVELTSAEAVRASANFPWVFDLPVLGSNENVRLIDGGVLDNSGLDAIDLLLTAVNNLAEDSSSPRERLNSVASKIMTKLKSRGLFLIEIDSGNIESKKSRLRAILEKILPNYLRPMFAITEAEGKKEEKIKEFHRTRIKNLLDGNFDKLTLTCNSFVMTSWTLGPNEIAQVMVSFVEESEMKLASLAKTIEEFEWGKNYVMEGGAAKMHVQALREERSEDDFRIAEKMRIKRKLEAYGVGVDEETLDSWLEPSLPSGVDEGWVFLGTFDGRSWLSRYFDFEDDFNPSNYQEGTQLSFTSIGSSNVRSNKPTEDGYFLPVIDVIHKGTQVVVKRIEPWLETGYYWALITYEKSSRDNAPPR
jgi:hypothetical protein